MLTGIDGGVARDVLLREIPTVLRGELYAVAALVGDSVVVVGAGRAPSGRAGRASCRAIVDHCSQQCPIDPNPFRIAADHDHQL